MADKTYNWKRFWCPRGGTISLADGGYLFDPDSESGQIYNPDLVYFESLTDQPCVVLLGEPGIGKTTALQSSYDALKLNLGKEGQQIIQMDLRAYRSEDRLVRDLFGASVFSSWVKGGHRLHIFLDGLDECLLRIDTFSLLFVEELRNCPIDRLSLRIACRTADWPPSLEEGLKKLWGETSVAIYELVPLRRIDVVGAAKANSLNYEKFLQQIDEKECVPLAIVPVTLSFLINTFKQTEGFPRNKGNLYLKGCKLLLTETSETRRTAKLTGSFDSDQRMAVAARIAAVTAFANRYAIWTGVDWGDVPDEDVVIRDLSGGEEYANEQPFQVTEGAVRETLSTGAFSSRGVNRMGWAHQTYAEFLAAHYLVQHKMSHPQMMSLLIHPADPDEKLAPQVHGVAAWLSAMVTEVFEDLAKREPQVLLQGDLTAASLNDKEFLVDQLLRHYDEGSAIRSAYDIQRGFEKLSHLGLPEQLRSYIGDLTKGMGTRRHAIEIAEACEVKALQNDLADMAVDSTQPLPLRVIATRAVASLGDGKTKSRLRGLLNSQTDEDPDDELKGYALNALWPDQITADELFDALTEPAENFIGSYHMFLVYELIKDLRAADLPAALKWVENQQARYHLAHAFDKLMDSIIIRAWDHLDDPRVLYGFCKAVLSRLNKHDKIIEERLGKSAQENFGTKVSNDDMKRRKVIEMLLSILSGPTSEIFLLLYSRPPLVLAKDLFWMIDRFHDAKLEDDQSKWAQLIYQSFDHHNAEQIDAVICASQKSPFLAERFSDLLKAVDIESLEARKMRSEYLKRKKKKESLENHPLLDPPPSVRVTERLDEVENGDMSAWWRLNLELTHGPDSTHDGDEYEPNLTLLPGWGNSTESTKHRIISAAKRYLMEGDPDTGQWLGKNTIYRPAFAGYRALRLLHQEEPSFLSSIPGHIWNRWAPIILSYPTSAGKDEREVQEELVGIAYQQAPSEIAETLMILIDKEDKENGGIHVTTLVGKCWNDYLSKALLKKAKDENMKSESMASLFEDLLDHGIAEAKLFIESLVTIPPPAMAVERERALKAARALMTHSQDAGWTVVWPAITAHIPFGKELFESINDFGHHEMASFKSLKENHLADLFIWLARAYPYAEDPKHKGVHWGGPIERLGDLKNTVLQFLENRGTYQACKEIERLSFEFPELTRLKTTLLYAKTNARKNTWTPPQPLEIIRLAANKQSRVVQGGSQLLQILKESLERLELKLQGETPAAIDLWDEIGKNVYRPRSETRLSDYLKRHFEADIKERGIIVNREVEIRRGEGPGQGERTDIHVDAVTPTSGRGSFESVTVVIEVKACWNGDLETSIERQLLNRYMTDSHCDHGLYVVGWFTCDQWDSSDRRIKRCPKMTIEKARQKFSAQAVGLSQAGKRVEAFVLNAALR